MTTDEGRGATVVGAGSASVPRASTVSAERPALSLCVAERVGRGVSSTMGMTMAMVVVALLATGCAPSSRGGIPLTSSPMTAPAMPSAAVASTTPSTRPTVGPPYIARVSWVSGSEGRSLRVYPTPAGRVAALSASAEAWSEVLRYAADAGTPGMRAQFDCHWIFARIVEPDKSSWNLEPGRPVVSQSEMQRTRCNPGGAEETVPDAGGSPSSTTGSAS